MKKLLSLLLVGALLLGLAACERRSQQSAASSSTSESDPLPDDDGDGYNANDDSPQSSERDPAAEGDAREVALAVRDCMAALKSGTRDNIDMHLDYDEFLSLQEGQSDDTLRTLLKRLDYEVTAIEVEGDFATAAVLVSNIDMHAVLGDYLRDAMDLEYNNALADSPKTAAQMESEYLQLFVDYLDRNSGNRREVTVEVALAKTGGWWRVQPNETMRAAVFGDYFEASSSVGPNAGGGSR